ncbi:MAG: DUF819 family protein [Gammaproteobacteria bacterium]|nr:DUF819 family protein [Gammaproteobacteria bacterium]
MSLISAEQIFQLAAVLIGLAAFGFWVETTSIGRKLSGVLIILFLGVVLSNIRLIPHSAALYGTISSLLVPLAIPMLLFQADLKRVLAEIGPMFKAFVASALVIAFSIALLTVLFDFGEYEAQVAGTLAASYIGGSLNFVATAQAVELTDPNHYVGALTADTIGAIFFMMVLLLMPSLSVARKAMPSRYFSADGEPVEAKSIVQEESGPAPFNIAGLAAALATSTAICALGQLIARTLGQDKYFILIITVLALAVANFAKPLVRRFNSEFEVGTFFMYLFFVTIGASADLATIAGTALPYVLLICGSVGIFFVLILVVGKVLKLDLAELMIASNACILGPATAAALAAGQGWRDLVTPGMLTGILGYSVGTFVGVTITALL